MYDYNNPNCRANVWSNIKISLLITAVLVSMSTLLSCGSRADSREQTAQASLDQQERELDSLLMPVPPDSNRVTAVGEVKARTEVTRSASANSLKDDVEAEMHANGLACLDVRIEGKSLWVSTPDMGNNLDGIAATLCSYARKRGLRGVTIFDQKLNRLGRSVCN